MATSKQERLYNDIIEYYNFADSLLSKLEEINDPTQEEFETVESIIETLEVQADNIATEYLNYVKGDLTMESLDKIRKYFTEILSKTEECRNKIYMLYEVKTEKDLR